MALIIGIDLGGSRIKTAVRNHQGVISHFGEAIFHDQEEANWKELILRTVSEVKEFYREEPAAIGISAPGLPNESATAIAYMPGRMEGLENFIWKKFLGYPTWVLNDGIAALMAESRSGVAVGRKNVVMVTLGTGVGGGILINGQPYMGAFGKAGHIGHMVIWESGDPDITGMPGSLEEAIGDCTILKRSQQKYASTKELLVAFREGDSFAREIWLTSLKRLALGLASLTNILSPEMIVLGGGITAADKDLFDPLRGFMDQYEWKAGGRGAPIVKALQGERAGAL
ncbi:MAG: ROK family protein, partial [Bacteroidota bacterium]|nr:ROK family protein [Bacteroidota bacterium]